MTTDSRLNRRCGGRNAKLRQAGFTLLEVLLSMVLAGALMAGLWGVLSLNLRTFEVGRVKTERAQLTRALAERIENDLRALAPLADELKVTQDRVSFRTGGRSPSLGDPLLPGAPMSTGTAMSPGNSTSPGAVTTSSAATTPNLSPPSIPAPASSPATSAGSSGAASVTPPAGAAPVGVSASPGLADSTSPTAYTPAPVYSLIGSSHALQLRVLTATADAEALPATDASGQLNTPLPRDLQIVEYRLEQPQLAPQPMDNLTPSTGPAWRGAGLSRRQRAWSIEVRSTDASASSNSGELAPVGEDAATGAGGYLGSSSSSTLGGESSSFRSGASEFPSDSSPLDSLTPQGAGSSFAPLPPGVRSEQFFVPEVTGWQLRYYDGQQWTTQWHSGRKGLPTAIEVTLSLRAEEPSGRRPPRKAATTNTPSDSSPDSQATIDGSAAARGREETMRLVVYLPSAWGPVSARDASQQPSGLTDPMSSDPSGGSTQLRGESGTGPAPGGSP